MRKLFTQTTLALVSLFACSGINIGYGQILSYTSAASGALNSVATHATGTSLTRVNGATAPGSPCGTGFSSNSFTSTTTYSSSLPAIETSVTPASGYALNVTSVSVDLRRSSTGPASVRLAYSTDGGTTWTDQGSNQSPNNASWGATTTGTWTTTINVGAPSALKFRVYGFNAGSTAGAFQILNLVINGTVTSTVSCPMPTGLSSGSITSSSAALSWSAATGATSYNIQYRKTGTTTWTSTTSTTTSTAISGLSASTTYEFQVQTVCSGGSSSFSSSSTFTTPASGGACDQTLWNHVYNNYRLIVIDSCTSFTGVVAHKINEADGDIHIRVTPDAAYSWMINSYNTSGQYGDMVVEPVCAVTITQSDAVAACTGFSNSVYIPNVGEHVIATGDYVTDNQHGWNEIHPVTSITIVAGRAGSNSGTGSGVFLNKEQVNVYPNPANETLYFDLEAKPSSVVYITIVDDIGRLGGQYQMLETHQLQVSTTYFPAGKYYYSVVHDNKVVKGGTVIVKH